MAVIRVVIVLAVWIGLWDRATADEQLNIDSQGIQRSAIVHRPAGASSPLPVVISLQGLGESIEALRSSIALDVTADRERFVVVYPEALEMRWNIAGFRDNAAANARDEDRAPEQPGAAAGNLDGARPNTNDIGFIETLISTLVEKKIADPARIYVVGVSLGGLMTYTLACALSDRIAAVVPLLTGMVESQRADCHPKRIAPLMLIAGTNDMVRSYDGWITPTGRFLSVPETLEFWRALHGCDSQEARSVTHREPSDGTRLRLIVWGGCKTQNALRFYRVNGGGHQVPSFSEPNEDSRRKYGPRNLDIEASDVIWDFLKQFAL